MTDKLSNTLQLIYNLELSLGNTVAQFNRSEPNGMPFVVIFTEPLHRSEIESNINIILPVRWYSVSKYAGYVNEDTRESIQGPIADSSTASEEVRDKLAPELQAIYDLEISLGNAIVRIDEPAGTHCPLAAILRHPLHKREIGSRIAL